MQATALDEGVSDLWGWSRALFDGDTYPGYVAGAAVRAAQEQLIAMGDATVRASSEDELVDRLFEVVAVQPLTYSDDRSGWYPDDPNNPAGAGEVRLRLDVRGARTAAQFLSLTPTTSSRVPGQARLQQPYVVVDGIRGADAPRVFEVLRSNIAQLNRDLPRHAQILREHLSNVVPSRKQEIRRADEGRQRAEEALRESGIPVFDRRVDEEAAAEQDRSSGEDARSRGGSAQAIEELNGIEVAHNEDLGRADSESQKLTDAPEHRAFLSEVSAQLVTGDPKAIEIVVTDVIRRMQLIADDPAHFDHLVRRHAHAAAGSIEIVLAGLTGEVEEFRTRQAQMSLGELLIELGKLGVELANPQVAIVFRAGLLIHRFARSRW